MPYSPLRDWNPRDALSAEHLQEAVRAIREDRIPLTKLISLLNQTPRFLELRMGKVATAGPNGEADFTDARYWVKFQRGSAATDGLRMDTVFDDDWTQEGGDQEILETWWTVVENLAERTGTGTSGSHGLQADQLVLCFGMWTSEENANRVYVMNQGGGAGVFPVNVQVVNPLATGSGTTTASFIYNVNTLTGNVLGTNVPLTRPRAVGAMVAQVNGYGLAFYDAGVLKLWDAGEIESTTECF